jgi:hypothetical protein
MSTDKPKKHEPERNKPGPEAERLIVKPELIVPGLDRLLKKKAPPMDQRKKRKRK